MRLIPEIIRDKPDGLARRFVRIASDAGAESIDARGRFAIAIPGGSVAEAFLPVLTEARLDWGKLHVFWTDERGVPADAADSNFNLARSLGFLGKLGSNQIHRMPADEPDLDRSARSYEQELAAVTGSPPVLDLVLLGWGPDGHVASLFPHHKLLEEGELFVAAVEDSPKPPERRMTLTLAAITQARLVVAAGFGPEKAAVLESALDGENRGPLALVLRQARRAVVLTDS
jgi:6-phosphogluconolactonase